MNTDRFAEQPGHAHYTACSGRMVEIDRFSRRCCGFTLIACGLMFITTWMTFRYGIISIIPNLIGDRSSLGANAFQSLLIILIAAAAVLGAVKYRFMTVLLFALYAAMFVSTCISTVAHEIFTVPVSLAGVFFTYKAPFMYRDYRILCKTEGFPHFNERLAYQEENREYKATYENEYHNVRTAEMAEPSTDYSNNISSAPKKAEMDEL
ncbi:MAG: hypothetical protein E7497_07375 [Ruminococcus sp.]|nr:hypothetical protein [Ruminococcus sp.]